MLRWDLYDAVGAPDIADLDGLLDTIKKIQDANPTNEDGDPAYGFSLWPDWDNNDGMIGIANVVQLTTWYGEKIKGSAILTTDDKFIPLTDKNGTYYKMLKFLYKANQMGLVDPDSGSQNWDAACAKMSSGRVYTFWYSWQVGFWNTQERLADGKGMIFIPVLDQKYYTTSDTYYGSGRIFGVGSGVDGEKYDRIMKFLDWCNSSEGQTLINAGLEGLTFDVNEDGHRFVPAEKSEEYTKNSQMYHNNINQLGMGVPGNLENPKAELKRGLTDLRQRYEDLNAQLAPYAVLNPCYPFVSETYTAFGSDLDTRINDAYHAAQQQ